MAPFTGVRPLHQRHFLSRDEWQAMKSAKPITHDEDCPVFGIITDRETANELLKADHRYHVTGVGYIAFTANQVAGQRIVATVYPTD